MADMSVAKWAWTKCQWYLVLHHGYSMRDVAITGYIRSFDRFYKVKHSESLCCSFEYKSSGDCLGGCHGNIAWLLPYKVFQLQIYRCLWSFATESTQDAEQDIVVARLTVIVKMGQGVCSFFICLERQPIQWLYIIKTNSQCNYLTGSTRNCWCSSSWSGRERVAFLLAYTGSQYCAYVYQQRSQC